MKWCKVCIDFLEVVKYYIKYYWIKVNKVGGGVVIRKKGILVDYWFIKL